MARLITGVAGIGYRPSSRWLSRFAGLVNANVARISPHMFQRIAGALRHLQYPPTSPHGWIVM